jgi:hypothetical protein
MIRFCLPVTLSVILVGGCIKDLPHAGDGGASDSNGSAGKTTGSAGSGGASGSGSGTAGASAGVAGSAAGQVGASGGDGGAGTGGGGGGGGAPAGNSGAGTGGNAGAGAGGVAGGSAGGGAGGNGGAGTGGNAGAGAGGVAGGSAGGGAGGNGGAGMGGHGGAGGGCAGGGGVGGGGAGGNVDGGAGTGSAGSDGGDATMGSGASDGAASSCSWTLKQPTLAAHGGEATAVLNGQLYLAAGFGSQTTEVYDPVANKWSGKAQFPANRCYPSGGAIGAKIYVAGGCDSCDCRVGTTGDLEEYDPAGDSWVPRAPMPTARSGAAAGVVGGKLIVAGGTGPCPPCTPLSTLEAYDPASNSWATLKSMPTARRNLSGGAVVGGKLTALGGIIVGAGSDTATDVVEAYDPVTNGWATLPPLPRPLYGVGAQAFRGQVLAIGGGDPSTSMPTKAVNILNLAGGGWMATAPILQVSAATCGEIAGVVYCVGAGAGNVPGTALQVFTCP